MLQLRDSEPLPLHALECIAHPYLTFRLIHTESTKEATAIQAKPRQNGDRHRGESLDRGSKRLGTVRLLQEHDSIWKPRVSFQASEIIRQ